MNYDKNSFISGIAVGRQLKGWAMIAAGEANATKARVFNKVINLMSMKVLDSGSLSAEISADNTGAITTGITAVCYLGAEVIGMEGASVSTTFDSTDMFTTGVTATAAIEEDEDTTEE